MSTEHRVLYAAAWFLPYDEFRGRPVGSGFTVALDRWDGAAWVPTGTAAVRTPSGSITYPGLGRRLDPASAEPDLYRARFDSAEYRPLYQLADAQDPFDGTQIGKEFLAYPWGDDQPPQIPAPPELVPLLPGPAFPYPPGTRVVRGHVRWGGSGAPVDNALVQAEGETVLEHTAWRERCLTDATGAFRLALRWAGVPVQTPQPVTGPEDYRLTATQRPGHSGELTIRLPDGLDQSHVIEISA